MKQIFSFILGLLLVPPLVLAAAPEKQEFERILGTRCVECHSRDRIEAAMARGENLDEIVAKMIRFGAKLTSQEQEVLGVFWRNPPAQQPQLEVGPTVAADPLGPYRAILESRCTTCHSLERVEKAMMEGRSIDELVEMMRRRGAVITGEEQKVLGTFWGEPLKPKPPQ